jgi:hypothetical protein
MARSGGGRTGPAAGSARGDLRAAGRADVVERVEEAVDVGRVAVHVRRDPDAAFPAPHEHAPLGEPRGQAGGIVGQEPDVPGPSARQGIASGSDVPPRWPTLCQPTVCGASVPTRRAL